MGGRVRGGGGVDCTTRDRAEARARVTGFKGRLRFDTSKPDGAPRKLLDVSRINALGWEAYVPLEEGLRDAYNAYLAALEQPWGH